MVLSFLIHTEKVISLFSVSLNPHQLRQSFITYYFKLITGEQLLTPLTAPLA